MGKPTMIDLNLLLQAGINPKTGLPLKLGGTEGSDLPDKIHQLLQVLDRQNAINRFKWGNLPDGITGELIERILYFKGQGMLFYMESVNKFLFLPYALDGTIDYYGRYEEVTPLPFNGTTDVDGKTPKPIITGLTRKPSYEILTDPTYNDMIDKCVILKDTSIGISQTNIPRSILQEPILSIMSECFPMLRTALFNSSGVKGVRVPDEDCATRVTSANNSVNKATLSGKRYIPVVGAIDFQELGNESVLKTEEYLIAMQSLDNFRLSLYGLKSGGLFQKKSHMLESEQQMNDGNVGMIYDEGLKLRQEFCDIANSIWGLGIYVEPSETVIGYDANQDGYISDGTEEQPQPNQEEGGSEENE